MCFYRIGLIKFPKPRFININMMPFIMGDPLSIPIEYRHYASLIEMCLLDPNEKYKIGYLSIAESFVKNGYTQKRIGIHTEKRAHGIACGKGSISVNPISNKINLSGGIFMASNVNESCQIWNINANNPKPIDIQSQIMETKCDPYKIKQNELIWFTDTCPHEVLPQKYSAIRQWFRIVTSQNSFWFSKTDTPNSLGIEPDCQIIHQSPVTFFENLKHNI
jgi:hypothetical protein